MSLISIVITRMTSNRVEVSFDPFVDVRTISFQQGFHASWMIDEVLICIINVHPLNTASSDALRISAYTTSILFKLSPLGKPYQQHALISHSVISCNIPQQTFYESFQKKFFGMRKQDFERPPSHSFVKNNVKRKFKCEGVCLCIK